MKQLFGKKSSTTFKLSNDATEKVFSKITVPLSSCTWHDKILQASLLETKLGSMIALADEKALYLLEFGDREDLKNRIERFRIKMNASIIGGSNNILEAIREELFLYFEGNLTQFKTPCHLLATPFQTLVWQQLTRIPYGQTQTYALQAKAIERHTAQRAVALANSTNRLAIIIPCHRVINSNGKLGGYAGGLNRKKWLLEHEKRSYLYASQ